MPQLAEPGHNVNGFIIILAAQHLTFDLLGISTVHDNSSLKNTNTHALSVPMALDRIDIPVYSNVEKPLCRPHTKPADDTHKENQKPTEQKTSPIHPQDPKQTSTP
ncbi:hypothetical protein BO78DRAFT_420983 [Aspergillus sclerotiicarbonarius CBS 121057]|uniref:Inosine/uridine-preferring nucleoside hydrolase domain-containing protein n=1 Tax=Aspergillus sclerotiicarbonarius (strain CBS 121057 / IBT 28362) TaxID=1448318 RepID=A0A319EK24_ASPSB|nr:hypothetical protein BO78DRAFT_420983 [Aspergillus sclerotiicarbonarius CBS 121057]